MFLAAALQMTSHGDKKANLEKALALVDEAARRGAQLVGLPETVLYMGPEKDKAQAAETLDGPSLRAFADKARQHKIHLLAGSVLESGAPGGRFYNTSVLFGPEGQRLGVYRKIHLFDVNIPDGARYQESETIEPGKDVVVAETALGKVGMAICYDLRFPELFRSMSQRGADVMLLPAAFTLHTGKDHWEVLLRARAIENFSYVVAPAQYGAHSEKKITYGRALIVDPWGTVIAKASDGDGTMAIAPIDRALIERVRRDVPSLQHRRL